MTLTSLSARSALSLIMSFVRVVRASLASLSFAFVCRHLEYFSNASRSFEPAVLNVVRSTSPDAKCVSRFGGVADAVTAPSLASLSSSTSEAQAGIRTRSAPNQRNTERMQVDKQVWFQVG